jgi:hypothetical protein
VQHDEVDRHVHLVVAPPQAVAQLAAQRQSPVARRALAVVAVAAPAARQSCLAAAAAAAGRPGYRRKKAPIREKACGVRQIVVAANTSFKKKRALC